MAAKSKIFQRLMGIETPVSQALARLSSMWNSDSEDGSAPPSEYRASRMTMILHIGFDCSPEQAEKIYHTVLDFSGQYPCRIILLCGRPDSWEEEGNMSCKIYSQCYIGASHNDMSCCEALIFEYALGDREHLENQISNFVETDLPAYYWPYRFDSPDRLSDYQFFFKEAERVVIDSAQESFVMEDLKVERPEKLRDLAYARLLPFRQCIGQFLSSFPPTQVVQSLDTVTLVCGEDFKAEGRSLLGWIEDALSDCHDSGSGKASSVKIKLEDGGSDYAKPRLSFGYSNDNRIECVFDLKKQEAKIEAVFDKETHSLTAAVSLLDDGKALAEALFFA